MKQSRAQFKLALRYCMKMLCVQTHNYASNLAYKDYTAFWNDVKRSRCEKFPSSAFGDID
jgi:hypothetical protein